MQLMRVIHAVNESDVKQSMSMIQAVNEENGYMPRCMVRIC